MSIRIEFDRDKVIETSANLGIQKETHPLQPILDIIKEYSEKSTVLSIIYKERKNPNDSFSKDYFLSIKFISNEEGIKAYNSIIQSNMGLFKRVVLRKKGS